MKTNPDTTPKLYVGLDVHKEQTSVAVADPGPQGEVRSHGSIITCQPSIEKMLRRIAKARGIALSDLHVCYEAGGCGMWIARKLLQLKVHCTVVAPSLIPSKAGDQVKTDKKDAIKLARLLRAGELTAVHVPDEADEAIRDLCRARVDAVDDLRRAKNRLQGLLRRLGHRYAGGATWSEAHMRYLRGLKLPYPSHAIILEEIIQQIGELQERIARNVKCGGTAAQDSQSEANKGAYPPLPPTTCSASCPSLVVAEFIRQLETLRSELSCLLGTHLNRIVMWYGDDFHMDGSTIWGNPTRDPLFVALILRCLIGWHVSLVFAERSR